MKLVTRLDRKTLLNHLAYHGWQYLLILGLSFLLWNLIYQQTAYRPPQGKRIDVYIQSSSSDQDQVNAFFKPIWESAVPEQELVSAVIMLSSGTDDYYAGMQLITYIAAAEGDIYMLSSNDFKRLASQGAFIPLDRYVSDGRIDAAGIDLAPGRVTIIETDAEGAVTSVSEPRLYGIPAAELYGFASDLLIDNRDMVLAVAVNGGNVEATVTFLDALIGATRGPKPDFFK